MSGSRTVKSLYYGKSEIAPDSMDIRYSTIDEPGVNRSLHNNQQIKNFGNVLKELEVFFRIHIIFVTNPSEICSHLPGERDWYETWFRA